MFYAFMLIFLILMILILLNFLLSKKMFKDREKNSSFECGFDLMSKNRLPFSLQFYLISIIFLIFDIEIAIVLPFIYLNLSSFYMMMLSILIILIILILGLYSEWIEGALK